MLTSRTFIKKVVITAICPKVDEIIGISVRGSCDAKVLDVSGEILRHLTENRYRNVDAIIENQNIKGDFSK